MVIDEIRLRDFRNFKDQKIGPLSGGLNLFIGPNGSGKTNILESISLASLTKSCRGALDSEMVRFGARAAFVEIGGEVEKKK